MSKRKFIAPYIILGVTGSDSGGVIGGGSGQGGVERPTNPMSYAAWLESDWRDDLLIDGEINEDDYAMWWESWGFSQEDWENLNPDLPWDDYFG